jgi:hypothetical protein
MVTFIVLFIYDLGPPIRIWFEGMKEKGFTRGRLRDPHIFEAEKLLFLFYFFIIYFVYVRDWKEWLDESEILATETNMLGYGTDSGKKEKLEEETYLNDVYVIFLFKLFARGIFVLLILDISFCI